MGSLCCLFKYHEIRQFNEPHSGTYPPFAVNNSAPKHQNTHKTLNNSQKNVPQNEQYLLNPNIFSYFCKAKNPSHQTKHNNIMARPIRNIPTLFGEEAKKFELEAARVEANPGTIRIPKQDAQLVRNVLRNLNL